MTFSRSTCFPLLAEGEEFTPAYGKDHIHRVLAHNRGQDAAVGRNDVSLRDLGPADLSGDGRPDVGVGKVDLGRVQVCLRLYDVCGGVFIRGFRLVALLRRPEAFLQKLFGALQLNLG